MGANGPPQLGADDVVRYASVEHFLEDYRENLALGRMFVRTRRNFAVQSTLRVAIEGPGVAWSVGADVLVLLSRAGFLGLEFLQFDEQVKPTLDLLVEEVRAEQEARRPAPAQPARRMIVPREEVTVIGALPSFLPSSAPDPTEGTRVELNPLSPQTFADPDTIGAGPARAPSSVLPPTSRASAAPLPTLPPEAMRGGNATDDDGESLGMLRRPPAFVMPKTRAEVEAERAAARRSRELDMALPRTRAEVESERASALRTRADAEPPALRTSFEPDYARVAPPRYDSDLEEVSGIVPLDEDDDDDSISYPPQPVLDPPVAAPPRLGSSALMELPATPLPAIAPPPATIAPAPRAPAEPLPTDTAPGSAASPLHELPTTDDAPSAVVSPPSLVDDLTPSPPAPSFDVLDALPGLRATPGGVVRVPDLSELLGLYLTHIRHGVIVLCGGPAGSVDGEVSIKLAAGRVVSLHGRITARVGAWVYVALDDASEVLELLRDASDDWLEALDRLGLKASRAAALAPSLPPAQEPAPPPSIPPPPASVPAPEPEPPAAVASEPPAPAVFDEPGAPQPGRLDGDTIVFRGPRDLDQEVQSNLKNGGLIAFSTPLPIRTHKSLRVVVGTVDLNVRIEADVVYAASGRVGFAVNSFAEAAAALDRLLRQGITPGTSTASSIAPPPPAGSMPPSGASIPPSTSMPPGPGSDGDIVGRVAKSLTPGELLELPTQKVESDDDLDELPALVVFDYISKRRTRGILQLKRGNDTVSVYMHDGSVAFVEARPWNEEHALGKLFAAQKKLTEPQIRDVVERSRRERRPFGKTLLAMGLVNANALVLTLREQTRLKIEPMFEWSAGSFEVLPWSDPPTRGDLVLTSGQSVVVKYVRHAFERMTSSEIEDMLAPSLTRVVAVTSDADPTASVYSFQPKELRFLQAWIDGRRNLSDVVTGSPVGRLASLRLVGFGLAMNLLRYTDGKRVNAARPVVARRSTDGRGYGAMKRQVEEDLRILREQNFFDVLGVHWSAHHRSYPAAYHKARARFDVTRGELRDAPPPVVALAKDAIAVIENAYKKLSIEEERIKYRKQLFDQTEREYSADMLVKQAEVLAMRGDRIGAIEAFETAVELAPTARNRTLLAQAREGRTL